MSSCNRRFFTLGALALGGCGFRPLYGGGTGSGPGALLQAVRIERESGELGFRVHESLIERLRPAANDAPLRLITRTRIDRDGLAIQDGDEVTRFNLRVFTRYTLRREGAGRSEATLTEGEVRSIAAYNATSSQYATLVAERQVLHRTAEEIADKIMKRLAVAYDPAWGA